MKGLLLFVERLCKLAVWFCGGAVLFMAFYICVDVLARKIFTVSIRGSDELSGYVLAIMSGWGFAYAFLRKNHIRIDVLYLRLSLKLRSILDIASLLVLAFFVFPLTFYSFEVFKTSWARNSLSNAPLQTPLWIPQSLWFLGLFFFSIIISLYFLLTLYNFLRGKVLEAYKLAGSTSIEEEVRSSDGG
ncbi:MAG: hypothetical protein PWQ16_332 [bacterium]|nr:hypothetical protein [bacterium]